MTRCEGQEERLAGCSMRSARLRLAWLITEVLAPAPIAAVLLIVVAVHSSATRFAALGWALLAVLFASVIPLAYVIWGVRRRTLTDRHVALRDQRFVPLLFGIASVLVGLILLSTLGAPQELVALVGAMMMGLVTSLLVTFVWKISMHTAVAAGAGTIAALVFGAPWLLLFLAVGLVGWARVELGDHTPAQVAGGTALGIMVAATVFTLLR